MQENSAKASASPNFGFMGDYDNRLQEAAMAAERYLFDDPVTALMRLRQFGELLAEEAAAQVGLYTGAEVSQVERLRGLSDRGLLKTFNRLFVPRSRIFLRRHRCR